MMNEIKVLIIENDRKDANAIRDGLLLLENEYLADKFIEENIEDYIVENESDSSEIKIKIVDKIRTKEIDVLFIDLNLLGSIIDGISIIRGLVEYRDTIIKNIPKYIITSDDSIELDDRYNDVIQYAYVIHKAPNADFNEYKEKFARERLTTTLPILVDTYREVKKSFDNKEVMTRFHNLLESIKEDTIDIKSKVNLIDNMNQTMIKFFPLTVTSEKQRAKLKEFIKNDISQYLDEELDEFFLEEEMKKTFLETVSKEFKETVEKDLKKGAWDTFKGSVKAIAKSQGINDENAALCAAKLTYKGYSEISRFLKGNTG